MAIARLVFGGSELELFKLKSVYFTWAFLLLAIRDLVNNLRDRISSISLNLSSMKKRKVLVLEREKYRQLAYYTLRTTLHLLLMFYEDEVKAMDLIEKASDSLHYSPWKHLPFSLFFKLVGFEPPLLTLVVPKMLVANALAIAVATVAIWVGKYLILMVNVGRYLLTVRQAQAEGEHTFNSPPQRILIVHGSVGAGHKRAAQAIAETFALEHPQIKVEVIDIVDFAGETFNQIYKKGYLSLAEKTWGSHLVGYVFDNTNKKKPGTMSRLFQESFLLDFINHIFTFKPDVIVNTHFLSTEIVAGLRRRKLLRVPQVTVVTDYDAHAFWANHPCETFFVGQEGAVANLTHVNPMIEEERVIVSGIPCVPAFSKCPAKRTCVKNLGLVGEKGRPVVIITASGAVYEGRPSIFTIYEQALSCETGIEIVVITGRQKDLREQLSKIPVPERHFVKLEGFTKVMHEYMAAADVIVTKPGGLTTAESLATGLAMVIVNPYPGQEMRNTDNLLENGIAVKANDLYLLGSKLNSIVSDPSRLKRMQRQSKSYGDSGACFTIAEHIASGEYGYIDLTKKA